MTTDFDYSTTGVLTPIRDHVLVTEMDNEDEKVVNGIIILGETGSDRGIHPRQAYVIAVGPDQTDVKAGEWILVEHGRWTRGVKLDDGNVYRKVDPASILGIYDMKADDSQSVGGETVVQHRHNMGGFE